jgi:HAD superfamily hydrolase (TIGR01549 family)
MTKALLDKQFHIFDLDDTLINTRWSYQEAQKAVIRKIIPPKNIRQFDQLYNLLSWCCQQTGSGNTKLYFDLFVRSTITDPAKWENSLSIALDCYVQHYECNLRANEEAKKYLSKLLKLSKDIAIVSNGDIVKQQRKLRLTYLDHFFQKDQIYVSSQYPLNCKKPSPFMIQKACDDIKCDSGNAIYYGNTSSDIIAANLAGVCSVFIQTTDMIDALKPEITQPVFKIKNWDALK